MAFPITPTVGVVVVFCYTCSGACAKHCSSPQCTQQALYSQASASILSSKSPIITCLKERLTSAAAVSAVLPELDEEGWTSDDFVRDMPVDYTLLVENLLDPGACCSASSDPVCVCCIVWLPPLLKLAVTVCTAQDAAFLCNSVCINCLPCWHWCIYHCQQRGKLQGPACS